MSDATEGIQVTPAARLSSYVKTTLVVHGAPVYLGAEFADEPLPDESFDDFSARVADATITHLAAQADTARESISKITRSTK